MPVNRNALIRYKTIDNCLRNRYRQWTLDDLIEACSEALYEYEGIDKGVSRRTVQNDIQMMRSEKLGYEAPIVVIDKKYYVYEDPEYSITNIPLTNQDLAKLSEVTDILRQFKGFTHFQELSGMVQKLEDKIHVSKTNERPVIDLEKNEHLKGLDFIDPVFQAIVNKQSLSLGYQSFKARTSNIFLFYPVLLKEYRNRWFVLGKKKPSQPYLLLALDRIVSLQTANQPMINLPQEEIEGYFHDVVGVSVNQGAPPEEVVLLIDHKNAPYVITKPIHHSQKIVERNNQGIIVSLQVQINFELEREILGFGDNIKVLSPTALKLRVKERLAHALDLYHADLNENRLKGLQKTLTNKGHLTLYHTYTKKEVNKINKLIQQYIDGLAPESTTAMHAIRAVFQKVPALKHVLFNHNLTKALGYLGADYFLTKALYFDKPAQANWYVTWHQDTTINVVEKLQVPGYQGWTKKETAFGVVPPETVLQNTVTVRVHLDDTAAENGALQVLTGSHKKRLNAEQKQLITESSIPHTVEVPTGGIHMMKPLLLHASTKSIIKKRRRVLHLEFNSVELEGGLAWAEKELLN